MVGYLVLFLSSCLLVLIITPLLRRVAVKNGVLDYPDERKIHKKAVPHVGGIAIAVSFFIPVLIAYLSRRFEVQESLKHLIALSIGALIIIALGVRDDLHGMNAPRKLTGQIAAASVLMPFGFVIRNLNIPFVGVVEVPWYLGVLLTLFWIVGITNTINFIDGLDGLAAGVTVTISLALFVISVLNGNDHVFMALICIALTGSLLGFLRYNFYPANIFMGDCGAMFLGLILAAVSVEVLFQNTNIAASSLLPVLIFGLPITDTCWAIIRRLRRRKSPFHADSFHSHHRLIDLGLSQFVAVVILYAASLLCVSASLIIILINSEKLAVILSAVMLAIALVGIVILNNISPPPKVMDTD